MKKLKLLSHVFLTVLGISLVTALSLLQLQQRSLAQSGDVLVDKTLNNASNVVRVGDVLSFTITVNNQSAFTLTQVRFVDTFDDNILQFMGQRLRKVARSGARSLGIMWPRL